MTTPPNKSTGDDVSDRVCEVPLLELMASIPPKLMAEWTDNDGLQAWHRAPVGKYLHDAIGVIRELQGFLQDAEARAAEYKNTAEAAIDAHQRALAQVDALTKDYADCCQGREYGVKQLNYYRDLALRRSK